jgi:hypothetical protein
MRFLKNIDSNSWMKILGLISVVWGLWYSNPIIREFIETNTVYFTPPLVVGIFVFILGLVSLLRLRRRVLRKLVIVTHIVFWSYLTIFLLITNLLSPTIPLTVALTLTSVIIYILQGDGENV